MGPIIIIVLFLVLISIKQVNQYERGVKFTLGKFSGMMKPGLNLVFPIIQSCKKIDIRTKVVDVPEQDAITKDNVSIRINAVVYYKIFDASKAILEVENFQYAVSQLSQTTMRNAVGEVTLDELLQKREINTGDAKDLSWIEDNSVDLVITSPPYLCSQDYIKTMRLMNLFFENEQAFQIDVKREIGPRSSRGGKSNIVVHQFYNDMSKVFTNISRVLKKEGVLALVVGQGKSKITSQYDIISDLICILKNEFGYNLIFRKERQIGNRVIQVGGVDKESILIFSK